MSGSDNATFRLRWRRIGIQAFLKAACLAWVCTFPVTALGQSLLCHHRSTCLKDTPDAPTVRACSLLQGISHRGTWAADKEEIEAIRAVRASGNPTHSGFERKHSITSIPQSIAFWAKTMFSSAVDANWTVGTVPQSLYASGRKHVIKLIQAAANHSQPLVSDMDSADGVVADSDAWEVYPRAGDKAYRNLLPLHLHMQGISLDNLMDRVTEKHSALMRYIDNRPGNNSFATKPSMIKGDSIAQVIEILRSQFAKVCNLPVSKFIVSSIHGRFLRPQGSSEFLQQNTSGGMLLQGPQSQTEMQEGIDLVSVVEEPDARFAEEVVVRFFVLGSNSLVQKVVDKLREEIGEKDSELRRGSLSSLLQRATITVGYDNDYMLTAANHVHGVEGLFVPVIVSVVFMMLLMWLSSI